MEPGWDWRAEGGGNVLLLKEGHSDHGFVEFAWVWNQLFFPGTIADMTCLVTSNNHTADEINTFLCMEMWQDLKFLLIFFFKN